MVEEDGSRSPTRRGDVSTAIQTYLDRRKPEWIKTKTMSEFLYENVFENDYSNEKSFRRVISNLKPTFEDSEDYEIRVAPSSGSIPTHEWRKTLAKCENCGAEGVFETDEEESIVCPSEDCSVNEISSN